MTIKNIIFDMGDVLVKIDPPKTVAAFVALGAEAETFASPEYKALYIEFHTNQIGSAQWRTKLNKLLNLNPTDEKFDEAWLASVVEPKEPSEDFIQRLQLITQWREQGFNIFLLSNNNQLHYLNTEKCYGELLIQAIPKEKQYYSHQTGNLKPQPETFTQILTEHNLKAHESIFLDDIPEYIKAAKEVGIHALLYTREEPLSKVMDEISRLNVNTCLTTMHYVTKMHGLFTAARHKKLAQFETPVLSAQRPSIN